MENKGEISFYKKGRFDIIDIIFKDIKEHKKISYEKRGRFTIIDEIYKPRSITMNGRFTVIDY